MARILITVKNVEEYIHRQSGSLYVGRQLILSPGARDYLQNQGISISYEEGPEQQGYEQKSPSAGGPVMELAAVAQDMSPLLARIIAILRDDYQITEQQKLQDLCLQIVRKINT